MENLDLDSNFDDDELLRARAESPTSVGPYAISDGEKFSPEFKTFIGKHLAMDARNDETNKPENRLTPQIKH